MIRLLRVVKILISCIALAGCANTTLTRTASSTSQPTPSARYADEVQQAAFVRQRIVEHFPDIYPTMLAIAYCETRARPFVHWEADGSLRPHATGASSAAGAFQVLLHLHQEAISARDLEMQNLDDYLEFVRHLYETGGYPFSPWAESRGCWQSRIGDFDPPTDETFASS